MNALNKISLSVDNLVDWMHQKYFARYKRMLQGGKLKELVESGHYCYVIANFENFRVIGKSHSDKDFYAPYANLITLDMMRNYLRRNPESFYFFAMHPLGLQALASEGYCGVIARMEREFVAIAKNFPSSFMINETARKDYVELVNKYLEAGVV